jgi:ADP-heptose:LPS heptosyltransferase
LELARHLGKILTGRADARPVPAVELPGDEASRREAREALDRAGLDPEVGFALFHPGMGGSALNLSLERYLELIDSVRKIFSYPVGLTEGPASQDKQLVSELVRRQPELKVVRGVSLAGLREVFRLAKVVVAPSTGPLHLAHYVGTRTIGVYSPVRSQRRERWAPWGGTGPTRVLAPEVACPARRECLGEACEDYFCMDKLAWGSLLSPEGSDLKRLSN